MRPITRPNRARKSVNKTTTIREFDGGWTVIDNDINLASRFSKVMNNVQRGDDGSVTVRYGTRLLSDLSEPIISSSQLGANPLATTNGSSTVVVTHTAHGFRNGWTITIAGATDTGGILAANLNTQHVISIVDQNSYQFTASTNATSTASGGGSSITLNEQNNGALGDIINITYFQDRLVAVTRIGTLLEIDSNGASSLIWSEDIAQTVDSTSGWGSTIFASFAVFGGDLIVCNGVNKPLIVNFDETNACKYLVDIPSQSNTNVPVASYVVSMNEYLIMAGDAANPSRIYISNTGTSGTWVGDAAPNDAVNIELGRIAQSQNGIVRGLGRFRDKLVVAFDDVIAIGTLGIFGGSGGTEHQPDFTDVIHGHGTVSHRTMIDLGDDFLMCDNVGVPSLARAQFTGQLRPRRLSELIDPEIQKQILALSVGTTENRVFAVYNQRDRQYLLFIPNSDTLVSTTETRCFAMRQITSDRTNVWSEMTGWNFSCACLTALKRVIFGGGRKLYVYGSKEDPVHADFVGDLDYPTPTEGEAITFDWELPWADFGERMMTKMTRNIYFDTKGSATYTAQMFVDNIYFDPVNGSYIPTLQMTFTAGDNIGYGVGEQPYGGLVRAADERSWAWTAKFKIMKLRLTATIRAPLSIVAISIAYQTGNMQR